MIRRILAGMAAGAALAAACTPTVTMAAAVAPYLEAPMQRLNIGQDQHSAFPGMTREQDGTLRLVWRQGSDHYLVGDGRIMTAESWDDGVSWTNTQTLRVNPDYRDPSIANIDGIEYLTWFGANASTPAMGAGVMREWNAESRRIDTLPYAAISAPVVKLPNGMLAAPFYGRQAGETLDTAWMAWSADNAWTWNAGPVGRPNRIVNEQAPGLATAEPYLVVNGSWTHMLVRWGSSGIGIRSSPDSGWTWQPTRKILDNATGRPTVISTAGTLVMVYREASTGSAVMAYSVDNGVSWQSDGVVLPAPAGGMMTYAAMVPSRDNPRVIRLVVGMEQAGGKTSQLWGGTVTLP